MSENNTDNVINVKPESVTDEPAKKSWASKLNPVPHVKKHPKIATAIGLGAALLVGAACFGPDSSDDEFVPTPTDDTDDEPAFDDSPSHDES